MKYWIKATDSGVLDISVPASGDEKERLLDSFRQCQDGTCACPSVEYGKLERVEVAADENGVTVRLHPGQGRKIDAAEVEKCVAWTKEKARRG